MLRKREPSSEPAAAPATAPIAAPPGPPATPSPAPTLAPPMAPRLPPVADDPPSTKTAAVTLTVRSPTVASGSAVVARRSSCAVSA
jgi:hypothetical protein